MNLPPLQRNRRGVFNLTIYGEDGGRQNLTGGGLDMYFKTNKIHTDAQAALHKSIGSGLTLVDAVNGEVQLELAAADSNGLDWSNGVLKIPLYFSTVFTDTAAKTWPVTGLSGVLPVVAG
jgi:hypothetical protein